MSTRPTACTQPVYLMGTSSISTHRPVFLDADGVLWPDIGPGSIFEQTARESFYKSICVISQTFPYSSLFVVSNQTCVARGLSSEKELRSRIEEVCNLDSEGLHALVFSYCPHHPKAEDVRFRADCRSRKPFPNQISSLIKSHGLEINESIMIGDRLTDLAAAESLGIREKYLITNPKAFQQNEISSEYVWPESIEFQISKDLEGITLLRNSRRA